MKRRLPKDQYLALQAFKKKVRQERLGKLIKDHSGHIYRVNEDGSLSRAGRDDLLPPSNEPAPGIKRV